MMMKVVFYFFFHHYPFYINFRRFWSLEENKKEHQQTLSVLNLFLCIGYQKFYIALIFHFEFKGSKGGVVVRALASYQYGPGLNPGIDAICGLSLLLVLSFAQRGFSPGTPVFPSP